MKISKILPVLFLSAVLAQAQEASEQLRQLQERFERQQREIRESFERMIRDQQAQIDALKRQLEARTNAPPMAADAKTGEVPSRTTEPWSPSDPIRIAGGTQNFINISLDGLFAAGTSTASDIESLQLGGHDPKQRGFTVQNLETTFDGKIDPYFRGQANIVL